MLGMAMGKTMASLCTGINSFLVHVAAAIPQERGFNCGRKQADLERASQVFHGKSLQA